MKSFVVNPIIRPPGYHQSHVMHESEQGKISARYTVPLNTPILNIKINSTLEPI